MSYMGNTTISTGRSGEDIPLIKERLGKLFGESPVLRGIQEEETKEELK